MYSWTVLVTPTTEASITKTRPPCQWQGGLFVFHTPVPYPKNPQTRMALGFFDSGYGYELELPRVGRSRRAGSLPPLGVPPLLPFTAQTLAASPLAFAAAPRWGSSNPLEHCPSVMIS